MRQARWSLTGFPICINQSQWISHIQSHQNAQSFFCVLVCFKKLIMERKILKSDDRWNTVWGNLSDFQVPEARCHAFVQSIFGTRVEFHFEYFILRLKSGLLNRINKSILQQSTSNFYSMEVRLIELADDCKNAHDTNSAWQ